MGKYSQLPMLWIESFWDIDVLLEHRSITHCLALVGRTRAYIPITT